MAGSWGLNALVHTLLVFFVPMGVLAEASTVDLYVSGTIVMMALVTGINARLLLMQNHISQVAAIVTAVRFPHVSCVCVCVCVCVCSCL